MFLVSHQPHLYKSASSAKSYWEHWGAFPNDTISHWGTASENHTEILVHTTGIAQVKTTLTLPSVGRVWGAWDAHTSREEM